MSDLISRQAAIDAIGRDPMGGLNYERILKYLPTAEPRVSPAKFRDTMIEIRERNDSDPEMTHIYMDKFMCKTLKLLGYGEGVEVFEKQDKWYS